MPLYSKHLWSKIWNLSPKSLLISQDSAKGVYSASSKKSFLNVSVDFGTDENAKNLRVIVKHFQLFLQTCLKLSIFIFMISSLLNLMLAIYFSLSFTRLIHSYLSNNPLEEILLGVFQGSVLGSLLTKISMYDFVRLRQDRFC